jgi:hypothetical protein
MDALTVFAVVLVFAYVLLYIRGRVYLREQFQDKPCTTVLDTSLQNKPYVTNEDKYGDFEQDFIYRNEGGFDPTREAIDAARRRFPFDWAQLPPSSSLFQAQQALFASDKSKTAAPFVSETFNDLDAAKVLPPDPAKQVTQDDLLKAYQPKATADMKAVDEKSVDELIQKIYGDKGLVAKVAKKANNVFEVYETMEKDPKIVYEDEVGQTHASMQDNALNPMVNPEEKLVVPSSVGDVTTGLTPYAGGESTRLPRQTYSDYNPNLEGIFGPKMQWQQWG